MLEPDQTAVIRVARQVVNVTDMIADALGRALGEHELF